LSVVNFWLGLVVGLWLTTPTARIAAISGFAAWLIVWVCTTEWLESRASIALEAREKLDVSGSTSVEATANITKTHT